MAAAFQPIARLDTFKRALLARYNGDFGSFSYLWGNAIEDAFREKNLWLICEDHPPTQVTSLDVRVVDRRSGKIYQINKSLNEYDEDGDPLRGTGTKGFLVRGMPPQVKLRDPAKYFEPDPNYPDDCKDAMQYSFGLSSKPKPEPVFGLMPSDGAIAPPPVITPAPAFMVEKHSKPMLGLDIIHNPDRKMT